MLSRSLFALSALSLVWAVPDAPIATNNPLGAIYVATLPDSTTTPIRGSVSGTTNNDGTGIQFAVSLSNFDPAHGPYVYHIHAKPVPADGNCTGAGPHLDPENRGEQPPCDSTTPQQCQVGDLAGKHGKINGTGFSAQYLDKYVSSIPGSAAFFGDKSLVVHNGTSARLTCANFTLLQPGSNSTGTATSTGSSGTAPTSTSGSVPSFTAATATPSASPFTGDATARSLSAGAALLAGVAFFL